MTDVRLTALNPEDSRVYPVACNSSGELLTTKTGEINLDVEGDLTVGGYGDFSSIIYSKSDLRVSATGDQIGNTSTKVGTTIYSYGSIHSAAATDNSIVFQGMRSDGTDATSQIKADGTTAFKGCISVDTSLSANFALDATNSSVKNGFGTIYARNNGDDGAACFQAVSSDGNVKARINNDGSVQFANGQAGFTAEGNLWCTTLRGDVVVLDATSNGIGSWAPYDPPQRTSLVSQESPKT